MRITSMLVPHLLIIEDDPDIAHLLQLDLQDAGYLVSHASSVMSGLTRIREEPPDLVLLDLGLPDGKGHDVLTRVRQHSSLPIVILTAQGDPSSKVELLTLGADDYLSKPFDIEELLARISVQLRRSSHALTKYGILEFSVPKRLVRCSGKEVPLSYMEFQILETLLSEPGRVFSKMELFELIWNKDAPANSNLLSVHMANLRNKLRDAGGHEVIRTVRGFGYAVRSDEN